MHLAKLESLLDFVVNNDSSTIDQYENRINKLNRSQNESERENKKNKKEFTLLGCMTVSTVIEHLFHYVHRLGLQKLLYMVFHI